MTKITSARIYEWFEEVMDPEIPVLSLVDLGVIDSVVIEGNHVKIVMTPTFVGCPALDMMQNQIRELLSHRGIDNVDIEVSFSKPWTSDRISAKGRAALTKFGLSPPPPRHLFTDLEILTNATCPKCGGTHTQLRSPFGTTLCRAIYYCVDCKEAFEQFKPL